MVWGLRWSKTTTRVLSGPTPPSPSKSVVTGHRDCRRNGGRGDRARFGGGGAERGVTERDCREARGSQRQERACWGGVGVEPR
jgi:hypothetical protein